MRPSIQLMPRDCSPQKGFGAPSYRDTFRAGDNLDIMWYMGPATVGESFACGMFLRKYNSAPEVWVQNIFGNRTFTYQSDTTTSLVSPWSGYVDSCNNTAIQHRWVIPRNLTTTGDFDWVIGIRKFTNISNGGWYEPADSMPFRIESSGDQSTNTNDQGTTSVQGGAGTITTGAAVGIAIGCLAFVILFALGLWWFMRRRKQRKVPSPKMEEIGKPELDATGMAQVQGETHEVDGTAHYGELDSRSRMPELYVQGQENQITEYYKPHIDLPPQELPAVSR